MIAAANPAYPEEAREAFAVIEKNALLEARLIDDLLDLTRIEHGKLGLELHRLDIYSVLRDALRTVRADLKDESISIALELPATSPHVMGDSGRLQQVFWNVLKNAVKFTPAGGTIKVSGLIDSVSNTLVIRVTDPGLGMDASELGRIFGAFGQGDHAELGRSHRFGGLGLGLAISRKLVEMHAGRIEAASAGKGLGSTFTIFLPILSDTKPDGSVIAPSKFHVIPLHRKSRAVCRDPADTCWWRITRRPAPPWAPCWKGAVMKSWRSAARRKRWRRPGKRNLPWCFPTSDCPTPMDLR